MYDTQPRPHTAHRTHTPKAMHKAEGYDAITVRRETREREAKRVPAQTHSQVRRADKIEFRGSRVRGEPLLLTLACANLPYSLLLSSIIQLCFT